MNNRTEDFEKAKAQMRSAQRTSPEAVEEEQEGAPAAPARFVAPQAQGVPANTMMENGTNNMSNISSGEVTVVDFLQAASQPKFIEKVWASKGKTLKIKKFTKGELDRISSPLFKRTMKLDLAKMGAAGGAMNVDISMDLFMEMEKILVEIGMSYYTHNNQPVITREYIDNVMTDDDFKELSALVKEVNPKALMAGVEGQQEVADAKKS